MLVGLLARETTGWWAEHLAGGLARFDPTAEDKRQARDALLALLAHETDGWRAGRLAAGLAQLDPTAEDKRQAREALVALLAREPTAQRPDDSLPGWPSSTPRRRTSARPATRCSRCWPVETDSVTAGRLAAGLAQLDPTAEDKRQARDALLAAGP